MDGKKGETEGLERSGKQINVCFPEKEYMDLSKKAKKARMSMSAFVRRAVSDKEVRSAPIEEVPVLIMEVRQVGSTLEQILREIRSCGAPGVLGLEQALAENREVERMIAYAYGSEWQ